MPLLNKFNRLAFGAVLATAALMVGCTQQIGGEAAAPELKGTTVAETLPISGAPITRIHLDGRNLKAGKNYEFNRASLTIDGDVPPETSITGYGGQILVTGNVGAGAELDAHVAYYWHRGASFMYGRGARRHKTVIDSLAPPYNQDPVIVVKGKLGEGVRLYTTTPGIHDYGPARYAGP